MGHGETKPVKSISVSDLKRTIDRAPGSWLVDVRTPEEYMHAHAPGVKCVIPHTDLPSSLAQLPSDRSTPIYLICRSGHRSHKAARVLMEQGFSEVFDVEGGMMEWVKTGFPVKSGPGVLARRS
jgi:rhodanese-related sulfurtransferase